MREPSLGILVQNPIREQFRILTENIGILTAVRKEVGPGLVGRTVEREVVAQIAALGELRERVFNGVVSGGIVQPLEATPSRIEVLDVFDYYASCTISTSSSPSLMLC